MKTRTLIAALLILALTLNVAARGRTQPQDDSGKAEITPEEEQEARALAGEFVRRLRATNDILPLVDELFVKDFNERLRRDNDGFPLALVTSEVISQATPNELRQFYNAELNLFYVSLQFGMLHRDEFKAEDGAIKDELTPEGLFPSEVLKELKSDLVISALIEQAFGSDKESSEDEKEKTEAGDIKTHEGDEIIKSLVELRGVVSTSEKAVALLREHLPPSSDLREVQRARISDEDFEEVHTPYLTTEDKEFYGFPPQTRLICVYVEPFHDLMFHLYLVEVDGHLKILTAYPVLGD